MTDWSVFDHSLELHQELTENAEIGTLWLLCAS